MSLLELPGLHAISADRSLVARGALDALDALVARWLG